MEDFSHQVARKWYQLYHGLMLAFSVLVAAGYGIMHIWPRFAPLGTSYGLSLTVTALAGAYVLYGLAAYQFSRRHSWPLVVFVGSLLFSLMLLTGIVQTDLSMQSLPFIVGWGITALFSGAFGIPFQLGSIFITALTILEQSRFQVQHVGEAAVLLLAVEAAAVSVGYFFWRHKFIDVEAQQLNRLSGMVRSNQQQAVILIQSIADGVIVIDTEGKISLMNRAAAGMTEWAVEEATGMDVQLVAKLRQEKGEELELAENPFRLTLTQKKHFAQTLQLTGRKGRQQIISLVVSPVVLPDTNEMAGAVAVMRDISEARAAEQQRAEFISTASHEMRTPVAAIEGYLALALNDKVSTVDSRAREFLQKAHSSTQHLGKLFQDLLTSAKAEDGRLSSHPVVIEMGSFLQQLVDDLGFAARNKGLATEFVIGSSESVDATVNNNDAASGHVLKPLYYAYADPDRLREVVTNLFDNAVKYTDEGKISIGLTGNEAVVQFYVRDSGAGIPAEDIPHLFQKFYRVDSSATRTVGGTGLGLFICRKIVELYKGRIWVESGVGKGSTFFVNLPRLDSQAASQLQTNEAQEALTNLPAGGSSPL